MELGTPQLKSVFSQDLHLNTRNSLSRIFSIVSSLPLWQTYLALSHASSIRKHQLLSTGDEHASTLAQAPLPFLV